MGRKLEIPDEKGDNSGTTEDSELVVVRGETLRDEVSIAIWLVGVGLTVVEKSEIEI